MAQVGMVSSSARAIEAQVVILDFGTPVTGDSENNFCNFGRGAGRQITLALYCATLLLCTDARARLRKMEKVTASEAAKKLAVSQTRVRAMLADGLLLGEKDESGDWMINVDSIEAQRAVYGQVSARLRLKVFLRDAGKCRNPGCGNDYTGISALHVHHVIPRAEGGTNDLDNLVTLCCGCHQTRHGLKKGSTSGRISVNYTVLPGTKEALGRLAVDGISAGEVIDRAVARYEREGGAVLLAFDAARVLEWMDDPQRVPASQAFTAGDERQVAYRFEEAAKSGAGEGILWPGGPPVSAWMRTKIGLLAADLGSERDAFDLVFDFYESCGGKCSYCRDSVAIREVEEGAAMPSEDASSLPVMSPTGLHGGSSAITCSCAHCGQPYQAERRGNLCPNCFRAGHRGDVRDCPGCNTGFSL